MAPISAVIPTYKRRDELALALRTILECRPAPSEVIVHVDGGDAETRQWIESAFPVVRVLSSADRVGPGGGRNRLLAAAANELVASFDDDSYPLQRDYFERLEKAFVGHPRAGIVATRIVLRGESIPRDDESPARWVASFVGCGCAYRRSAFVATSGFVPLPVAYGMEEVDLALQLQNSPWGILYVPDLIVLHDTAFTHHASPEVTAHSIANIALLAYLRYPVPYWVLGGAQVAHRVFWLLQQGRTSGVIRGLFMIPHHLFRHRRHRRPVSRETLRRFLELRRSAG